MKRKSKLLAINAQAHALDQAARSPRKGHRHSETAMTFLGGTQKTQGGAKFFSAMPSPSKNKGTNSIFLTGLGELAAVSPNPHENTRLTSISPSGKTAPHSRVQFYNTSGPRSALSTIQGGSSSLPDIVASEALLKEMQREKERLHRYFQSKERTQKVLE